MTKLNPTLNQINVAFPSKSSGNGLNNQHNTSGVPIRFIPVEEIISSSTGQVGWHGSSWEIFKTKTGKLLCALCEWSCVDGESDYLQVIVAGNFKTLFEKVSTIDGTAASRVAEFCATETDCVPTI